MKTQRDLLATVGGDRDLPDVVLRGPMEESSASGAEFVEPESGVADGLRPERRLDVARYWCRQRLCRVESALRGRHPATIPPIRRGVGATAPDAAEFFPGTRE
jgi:hypothetical protein